MSLVSHDELAQRVTSGAAMLDATQPGWAERVLPQLDRLDMSRTDDDIVSLVTGSTFYRGLGILRVAHGPDRTYGFRLAPEDVGSTENHSSTYGLLTSLWRQEVEKRTGDGA